MYAWSSEPLSAPATVQSDDALSGFRGLSDEAAPQRITAGEYLAGLVTVLLRVAGIAGVIFAVLAWLTLMTLAFGD